MNQSEELRMTYSGLLMYKGEKTVRVKFERGKNDFAEGIVPSGIIEKSAGFSEEELEQLGNYLKFNASDIMTKAKEVNPIRDWLHGNEPASFLSLLFHSNRLMLPRNRVNHPLRNIGRMVANSLKVFCHHKQIRCLLTMLCICPNQFNQGRLYFTE